LAPNVDLRDVKPGESLTIQARNPDEIISPELTLAWPMLRIVTENCKHEIAIQPQVFAFPIRLPLIDRAACRRFSRRVKEARRAPDVSFAPKLNSPKT
jgi:hypothetical protein